LKKRGRIWGWKRSASQWNDRAIARTTPALLSLYSIVMLTAQQLIEKRTACMRSTAWYRKTRHTCSDTIAFIHYFTALLLQLLLPQHEQLQLQHADPDVRNSTNNPISATRLVLPRRVVISASLCTVLENWSPSRVL